MTSKQLSEWYAYLDLEPIGELRQDYRAGVICATLANYAGKIRKTDAEPAHPADFISTLDAFREAKLPDVILLDDPAAQAALIKQQLFGIK